MAMPTVPGVVSLLSLIPVDDDAAGQVSFIVIFSCLHHQFTGDLSSLFLSFLVNESGRS